MIKYKDLLIGTAIGLVLSFIGCVLFITIFTSMGLEEGFTNLKSQGNLGKLITLGTLLNIGVVYLLFKKNKDTMAKGVILSIFILTIYTVFV